MIRFFAVLIAVSCLAACATGSSIVTGTKRPAVAASAVQIHSRPPSEYEVIGIVRASSEMGLTVQASMDYAIEELKKQAAALGANGILLTSLGGRADAPTVVGEAIYVPKR